MDHDSSNRGAARYCVIASVRPDRVARVREAISAVRPLFVITSEATVWGEGRPLQYRGVTHRMDDSVVRLEIACEERHVDWIVHAIEKALEKGRARGTPERVIALPVRAVAGF